MFNLFSKKKKFKANCELSKMPVDRESAFALSTAQIISSRKFWDNVMTEPETINYTEAHFKTGDKTATHIRTMIFNKYASADKMWVVSDAQIHLFEVDHDESRDMAKQWWDSQGQNVPPHLTNSLSEMDASTFHELKEYAINDAGRTLVRV